VDVSRQKLGSWKYCGQRDDDRGAVEKEEEAIKHFGDDSPLLRDAIHGVLV